METICAFTSFSIYVSKTCPRRLSNYHHNGRNRIHIRTLVYRVTNYPTTPLSWSYKHILIYHIYIYIWKRVRLSNSTEDKNPRIDRSLYSCTANTVSADDQALARASADKEPSNQQSWYHQRPHEIFRCPNGPLARYVKLRLGHPPGMLGTFSPPPRVSDPDMHHGTCVMQVPWCMLGWLTSGFLWSRWRENVPGILGACATRNITYLVRGPWQDLNIPQKKSMHPPFPLIFSSPSAIEKK